MVKFTFFSIVLTMYVFSVLIFSFVTVHLRSYCILKSMTMTMTKLLLFKSAKGENKE